MTGKATNLRLFSLLIYACVAAVALFSTAVHAYQSCGSVSVDPTGSCICDKTTQLCGAKNYLVLDNAGCEKIMDNSYHYLGYMNWGCCKVGLGEMGCGPVPDDTNPEHCRWVTGGGGATSVYCPTFDNNKDACNVVGCTWVPSPHCVHGGYKCGPDSLPPGSSCCVTGESDPLYCLRTDNSPHPYLCTNCLMPASPEDCTASPAPCCRFGPAPWCNVTSKRCEVAPPSCAEAGAVCAASGGCCTGLSCNGTKYVTGEKMCCIPDASSTQCIFGSQCCSGVCNRHVCEATMCTFVPTVKSYVDVTLDPELHAVSVFVYNQSEKDYIKTLLPNATVFVANLSDKANPTLCYTATDSNGWLLYPYAPDVPGCTDYWFIFCPLAAAAQDTPEGLAARELCLNSTGLSHAGAESTNLLLHPVVCLGGDPPVVKNYQEHILSHNELYFCNKVIPSYASLCWPLMLILGLLLGAGFAVGKNPFMAFDLSSPRLARGRQYSARVQNMSFDILGYLMAAAQAGMSAKGSKSKDKKSDSAKSGGKEGDKKKTTAGQILQSLGKSFAGKDPKSDKGGKIKILPGKDAKGDKGGGKDGGKGAVGGKGGAVGGNAPGGGSGKPQAGGTNQAQANNTVARMESLPSTGLATGKTMIPMVIMPRAGGSGRSGEGKGAGSGKTWAGRQLQKVGGYLKADFKQTFGFSGADSEKSKARQSDRQERRNSYSNRGRDANNSHRTNSATGKKLNADGQTRKEMKTNQKIEREKKLSGGFSKTENKMALKAQASAWSIKGGMHADGKTINTDGKLNAGDITALKDLKMNMKIEAATTVKASISGGAPQAEGSKEAGGQGTGASPKSGAVGMVNPSQSQGLAAMNAGGAPIAQVASLFKGGDKHQGVAADRKIANATFRKSNVVRNEKGKKTVASTSGKQVTKKEFKREQKANRQEARNPGGVSKMANKMSRIEAAAAMKKEHGGKLTEDDLKTLRNMKMDQKISDEKATTTGGFSKTENKQDLQMAKAYLKGKNPDGKLTANDKETIRSDKQDQKIKNEKAGSQARGTSVDGKGFSRTEGRAKVNARMAEMKGTDKDGKPIERDLTPAEVKELRGMEREQRKNRQPSSQSTEMTGRAASARGSGQYEDAVGYEIAGFSLNGKNFGQSLLAILKLLADIVLTKYGLNTSDVGKIFEKGSWGSGLKPIVNKIVDLIKLLLAVYSMLCEISNYTKAVQAMSGKSAPKGFMDDFNNNELFNIGKYHANTNALLSWLDPRMQGAGTGPGLVYPFSLIINPVMDGLKLGLGSVAQGIDNAVTSKKFDAPVAMATDGFFGVTAGSQGKTYYKKEQEEKWVEYDPKTRTYFKDDDEETAQLKGAGMPVKESPIGSVSGSDRLPVPKGAVTNVIKGKKSPKKYKFRVQTGIWKQCDASTLTASEKESLDKSVSEQPITFISAKAGNGIELDILQKKGYASRLAEKVDMKAEAGVYLLKYFGGVFGYDRRKGVEANIGALRNQSAVLRNKDSSAADLAMAQDYVNMTRSLMGKINSNEMMRDAIDMKHDRKTEEKINGLKIGGALAGKTNKEIKEYVNAQVKSKALDGKTGDEIKDYFQAAQERKDAEAELKTLKGDSSDPKKIIVGEIDKQAMGTHAYNATKGKITELEATMNLSDLLGAVEMPFSRKDIRHANKVTQELFAIQLDATVMFCNAYFSANDQGSKDAVSAVFAPLLDGFNNFTKAAPGQKDVRLGELDIRLSGLKAQAEAAEQGLPAILKAPAKNDKTAMVNGLQDLIAAAGERVRAEETKKEKEKASENITFEPPQIQADVSLSGSMADYAKNEFKQEKEDQRVTDIEDAYISAKKDAQAAPIKEAAASVAFYSAVAAANNDTKLAEEGDALAEKQDKSAFIQDSEDYAEKVKELYVPKQPKESASKPSQSPQNQEFMDLYKKR